jgi:hypothetical protein
MNFANSPTSCSELPSCNWKSEVAWVTAIGKPRDNKRCVRTIYCRNSAQGEIDTEAPAKAFHRWLSEERGSWRAKEFSLAKCPQLFTNV